MSVDDKIIAQTVEAMELMCGALGDMARTVLPESRDRFALMAEGPLDQLEKLLREVHEYVDSVESRWNGGEAVKAREPELQDAAR